jgi:hypothetical protein
MAPYSNGNWRSENKEIRNERKKKMLKLENQESVFLTWVANEEG